MVIQGSRTFQASCVERIRGVLAEHGYADVTFVRRTDGRFRWVASFVFQGKRHKIEVYEDGPVMLCGKQLFEPYQPEEFQDKQALREGFATRLDRYLSGGSWEGPDEAGVWESLKASLKRIFSR